MNRDDQRVIDGMRRQSALRRDEYAEANRLGWKAGFGTKAAMSKIGTDQPLAGFLTDSTLLETGTGVSPEGWDAPLLEPEVAVRIGSDLGSGAGPDDAAGAIEAVAAAIEIVDLEATDQVEEILAGNIFHRYVALGEFQGCDRATLDELRISVRVDGSGGSPSDPRELIGGYGKILCAMADQAELTGERLRSGDIVITGAAVTPLALDSGRSYEVSITGGSHVSVEIE